MGRVSRLVVACARDFLGEYVRELRADAVAEHGGGFTVAPRAGEDGGAAGSDALDDVRAQAVLEGERGEVGDGRG